MYTNSASWLVGLRRLLPAVVALTLAASIASRADAAQQGTGAASPSPSAEPSDSSPQQPPEIAVPLPKGKKLVLTDGNFTMVREYQRQGDRVRYYSLERSEWEEIPASLVNWDATEKAEVERQAADSALEAKIRENARAKRIADIDSDRSFEVRPGLILPDDAGLYALDGGTIRAMHQDQAESRLDKGRTAERILAGTPMISEKRHVDIPGKRAKIRLQSHDPEFYFRTADGRDPQITLVRADTENGKRELETIVTNIAGQVSYQNHEMSMQEWDAAHSLYRFTLDQTLEPGEYAIIESTQEGHDMFVWDFGVDPSGGDAPDGGDKKK